MPTSWKTYAISTGVLVLMAVPALSETIPMITKSTQSYYFQVMMAGARQAGKDLKIDVPELGPTSFSDIAGQIGILENAVTNKADAIVISPLDFNALGQPITEAATHVPVIGTDSGAETDAFTSMLSTDNRQGGRDAADALASAIQSEYGAPEGGVALLMLMAGQSTLDQRAAGFKEQLAAKYPKIKLVTERLGDGQVTTALNTMTDIITSNPNLRGVFGSDLVTGAGAGQAIAENGLQGKVKLVSFDTDENLVKMLQDGVVSALVVQDPYRMGYAGVKTALAAVRGERIERAIDTGVTIITKDNMSSQRSQSLLNPKID
ncbi:ABC transporter substrate-binding protein [Mesorhizobium zhangyense]|nr:ABC transporter substrate-binding protein [Mesorhizobium zhangyense]